MTPAQPWSNPSRFRWQWAAALAGALSLGLAAAIAGYSTPVALGLLLGGLALIGLLTLWQAPSLILMGLLLNIWLVAGRADPNDLLQTYPLARSLSYLIIPVFALLVLARVLLSGRRWRRTGLEYWFVALALLTVVSGLVNHTGASAIILSLAIYLRYGLLFMALYNLGWGERPYWDFIKALVLVAVALIAEAIFNRVLFGKFSDGTFFTTGVQYGTSNAGLLMVYATCVVFAHALVTRWRWYHLLFLIGLGVAAWIATIRSLLILVPLLPLTMWAVRQRLVGTRRLPRLALAGLVGFTGLAMALGPDLAAPSTAFGVPFFVQLRTIGVQDVLTIMVEQNREWLGFGPRSYSPGTLGSAGEMYQLEIQRHSSYWVSNFALGELTIGLAELGLVGFGVYWLMLTAVLVSALQFWREYMAAEPDARQRERWSLISLAFVGIWIHYALLGLIYYDIWRLDATSLVFWVFAAAIYARRRAWRRQMLEAQP